MAKGVSVTLYDASGSAYASGTDIAVLWFDSDLPPNLGTIKGQSAIATTTSGGVLSLDLDHVTGLSVGDWGFLVCYKLDGSDHEDSPTFASRMQVASMSGTTRLGPITDWVRNPDWPAQVAPVNGVEKITGLVAVFDHPSNFIAFQCSGAITIDWGDGGGTENVAAATQAEHLYTYSSVSGTIVGTSDAVAVTFTDSGDTVDYTAHGYQNGQPLVFATIVTTTGISTNTTYYVVNKATNTFQVAATRGGSAIALTSDGSGTVFIPQYKVAVITITPQAANNITNFTLQKKHSQSGLQAYVNPWLSLAVNSSSLTTMVIGAESGTRSRQMLEEFYLGENAITSFQDMFSSCQALQSFPQLNTSAGIYFGACFQACSRLRSIPYIDTSSGIDFQFMFSSNLAIQTIPLLDSSGVTNFTSMFNGCRALVSIPLLDMSSATTATGMLSNCSILETIPALQPTIATDLSSLCSGCSALRSVPLLDTSSATSFQSTFANCRALTTIPLIDTSSAFNFTDMFSGCQSLRSVPLLDTSSGTNFSSMFANCFSLRSIPLLNTSIGTNFTTMFNSCYSLQQVPLLNTASGGTLSSMFVSTFSLSSARLAGTAQSISYASCRLSAAELDDIFTGLATVTSKTITITGNYGAGSCTTSIATGKGWTVTN